MTPHEIVRRMHAHAFGSLDRCQRTASITAVDVHIDRMPVTELGDDVPTASRDSRRDLRHRAEPGEAHRLYSASLGPAVSSCQFPVSVQIGPFSLIHWELVTGNWQLACDSIR